MDFFFTMCQTVVVIDHLSVLTARGFIRPTMTESRLIALLAKGFTSFPWYRFTRFSLRNYPHIDIRNAEISDLLEISWVINTFNCTGCTIAADFYRKSLSRAQLSNTTLRGSNFQGADLCYALLNGADCRGVNFSHARLHEVNAVGADFRHAQLYEAVSRGGNFTNVRFDGAATRRFFVTPSESTGFMADVRPISALGKHPVQTETALGQSLGRINRMIIDFHQNLPKITKMMLDTLVVLLVIFVAAKVKEAQSESRLIDSAGATLAPLEQQQEQQR